MIIVSACLAGQNCKYTGGNNLELHIVRLVEQGKAIPVCPEVLGGLPTPRPACEISGGNGHDVLAGRAKVFNLDGKDVTAEFVAGAKIILEKAIKQHGVKVAILKERSPSCGVNIIYDGTFNSVRKPGQGVLAALLSQYGVKLYSEEDHWELLK
ncbi:DUF523 domain-containing protein [Peptococcaceae bacterium 1198_IL3148]